MQSAPTRIFRKMPKKYLKKWPAFLLLTLAVILVLTFLNRPPENKNQAPSSIFSDKSFTSYAQFAKQNGPQKAYQLLKENFPDNNPFAHDFAHVIGITAYEQNGPQGLGICDTAYNYGCYHGFIETFLVKKGIGAILEIEKNCSALGSVHAPSCLHGIGHGVLANRAYKLTEALEDCDIMQEKNRIYCWDGVFMERVTGSMQNAKDRVVITNETLFEPCNQIGGIYKGQCWRNQVTSWLTFFKRDTQEVGNMCLKIEKEHQATCFESIGLANVMWAQEDQIKLLNLCKILPNGNYSNECLIGELKELLFEGKSASIAQNLCNYVSRLAKQECLSTFNQQRDQSRARFGS
ncbi:hypothetical protein HYU92_05065 [Candidatus Curtissbacteria bacterium]|nr:hypothetical protein [Candidatus Curtissbacteria bacterium]